jgi:hypothetical protein
MENDSSTERPKAERENKKLPGVRVVRDEIPGCFHVEHKSCAQQGHEYMGRLVRDADLKAFADECRREGRAELEKELRGKIFPLFNSPESFHDLKFWISRIFDELTSLKERS